MMLTIDSGNTNIVFAVFNDDGTIAGQWRAATNVNRTADEFGMWLRLTDDYSVRGSYDAVMLIVDFLISVVYFVDFWYRVLEIFGRLNRIRRRERREEREHRDEAQS